MTPKRARSPGAPAGRPSSASRCWASGRWPTPRPTTCCARPTRPAAHPGRLRPALAPAGLRRQRRPGRAGDPDRLGRDHAAPRVPSRARRLAGAARAGAGPGRRPDRALRRLQHQHDQPVLPARAAERRRSPSPSAATMPPRRIRLRPNPSRSDLAVRPPSVCVLAARLRAARSARAGPPRARPRPAARPQPAPSPSATALPIRVVTQGGNGQYVTIVQSVQGRKVYTIRALSSVAAAERRRATASRDARAAARDLRRPGRGATIADAPKAQVTERDKSVVMTGGVRATTSEGNVLTCDALTYDGATERLRGEGHVRLSVAQRLRAGRRPPRRRRAFAGREDHLGSAPVTERDRIVMSDLEKRYGAAHRRQGRQRRGPARRGGRAARPQRRRQDDHVLHGGRPGAARRRQRRARARRQRARDHRRADARARPRGHRATWRRRTRSSASSPSATTCA